MLLFYWWFWDSERIICLSTSYRQLRAEISVQIQLGSNVTHVHLLRVPLPWPYPGLTELFPCLSESSSLALRVPCPPADLGSTARTQLTPHVWCPSSPPDLHESYITNLGFGIWRAAANVARCQCGALPTCGAYALICEKQEMEKI